MTVKILVSRDFTAEAMGASRTAAAIAAAAAARKLKVDIIRTGSPGLYWLEPLVQVERQDGARVAYGPVSPGDVEGLFEADLVNGGPHPLRLGSLGDIDYLKTQERLTFARAGHTDPLSLADYEAQAGYRGLRAALDMNPAAIVEEVTASGLRGRGGAGGADRRNQPRSSRRRTAGAWESRALPVAASTGSRSREEYHRPRRRIGRQVTDRSPP